MHNIISLTLFSGMGPKWKKIKELRPPSELQLELGLGKFPNPQVHFSPCHTTSQSYSNIPACSSFWFFYKQDKSLLNQLLLQTEPPGLEQEEEVKKGRVLNKRACALWKGNSSLEQGTMFHTNPPCHQSPLHSSFAGAPGRYRSWQLPATLLFMSADVRWLNHCRVAFLFAFCC